MGQRLVNVKLTNCGRKAYQVEGHPDVDALDSDGVTVGSSRPGVLSEDMTDPKPRALTVKPGDAVFAQLSWRATLTVEGGGYQAEQITVTARPGGTSGTIPLGIDMGDTGVLFVSAWRPYSSGDIDSSQDH